MQRKRSGLTDYVGKVGGRSGRVLKGMRQEKSDERSCHLDNQGNGRRTLKVC